VPESLGILETTGFSPAMVALDAMEKGANIRVLQVELNDFYGTVVKIVGGVESVQAALEIGKAVAEKMQGKPIVALLSAPDPQVAQLADGPVEYNPLIQQNVVHLPRSFGASAQMAELPSALGFIETQGFTAVFDAIDRACKAAPVDVVCKEKLGGGYVTVIVSGDVAAVKAAVDAAQANVSSLGKLIAAHVVTRPSAAVMSLLPITPAK
jgi:carbon dioxide concentrating mechanism protein CcmO